MPDAPLSLDPEHLLEHAGWLRALARSLVRDPSSAEDLMQQTWTAAIEAPPRQEGAARAWLGSVVRNLAARRHREMVRRHRRERLVARHEGVESSTGSLLERAELQRRVVDAVLALEEPYRTTVLLRFFEEMEPGDVARRLGIPVATVWTRLNRAMEKLRAALDSEYGDRRSAWCSLLLPLAGLEEGAGGALGTAGGAGSGAVAASSISSGTISASLPATLWTAGGIIVTQKTIAAIAAMGVVSLALGVGIGRGTAPSPEPEEGKMIVARQDVDDLRSENEELTRRIAAVETEKAQAVTEKEELAARVSTLDMEIQTMRASAAEIETASVEAHAIPISFGKWAELEEIQKADWKVMAEATLNMYSLLVDLMDDLKEDRPPPPDLQQQVSVENNKLVKYAATVMGKIPTNSPVNGEFTHPVTLANIMAALLELSEVPLSEAQKARIARLGEEHDEEYAYLQTTYDEDTVKARKVVDELALKRDTMLAIEDLLNAEQRAVVVQPEVHNRLRLDVLSPVNMVVMLVQPMRRNSPEALRATIAGVFADGYGFDAEALATQDEVFDAWLADVQPILAPVEETMLGFMPLDDIVVAGQAYVKTLSALLDRLEVSENTGAKALASPGWVVPRVVAVSN
ncbi:MAG: RNA polymerase sigma factor [Planctomycetota bacterium]